MTRRGISDMTRFTPGGGAGEVRPDARRSTPTSRRCVATRATTCRRIPGVGEKTAAKWIREFGSLDALVDRVDEVHGQGRRRVARAPRRRACSTASSPSCDATCRSTSRPPTSQLGQWDREAVNELFDTLQFRVLRERLYATLSVAEPESATRASRSTARCSAPGDVPQWLDEHARAGRARTGCRSPALGPGHRRRHRARDRVAADGAARLDRPRAADRATTRPRSPPGSPTRPSPKALHDVKGPLLALAERGWPLAGVVSDTALAAYLALPGQRSFDLADLALRYLHRELRAESGARRPAVARRRRRGGRGAGRDAPRPRRPRPRRRARRRARATAAARGC